MRYKPVIGLNTDFHVGPTAKASCCYVWAGYFDSVARAAPCPSFFHRSPICRPFTRCWIG